MSGFALVQRLSATARDRLLAAEPPLHRNVHADHCTLAYLPAEADVRGGLPIGEKVLLTTLGVVCGVAFQVSANELDHTSRATVLVPRLVVPGEGARWEEWLGTVPNSLLG